MTLDDAKTKWCPFTRIRTLYDVSAREGELERDAQMNCIGYDCMAWRRDIRRGALPGGHCGLAGSDA